MIRRLLAPLVLAAGLLLVPVPAHAVDLPGKLPELPIPGDCKNDVKVSDPTSGPAAAIDPGPKGPPGPGVPGTPNGPSMYEVYGFGGLTWTDYDPTCQQKVNPVDDQSSMGTLARLGFHVLTLAVAFVILLIRLAFDPSVLGIFDPILRLSAEGFGQRLFLPLFAVAAGIGALWIARHAYRARTSQVASGLGGITILAAVGIAATMWSLVIAPQVDRAVVGVVGEANAALAGGTSRPGEGTESIADKVAGNLHRALLYETWAAGTFGRANSETAKQYGPQLFAASTLTRAEAKLPDEQRERIIEAKKDRYDEIANRVKEEDPAAFEYLAGQRNDDRFGSMLLGWFGFACVAVVEGVANAVMGIALVAVRFALMVLPLVALIAMLPGLRHKMRNLLDWLGGLLLLAVASGVIAAAHMAAIGAFLSPETGTSPFVALLMMGFATVAALGLMWALAKSRRHRLKERSRRRQHDEQQDTSDTPSEGLGEAGARAQRDRTYVTVTPAETGFTGHVSQAALVAGVTALSAGAGTSAALAAAGRGAAVEGTTRAAGALTGGSARAQDLAGAGAQRALTPTAARAGVSADTRALPAGGGAPSTAEHGPLERTAPAPMSEPPSRVFRPGEGPQVEAPAREAAPDGSYRIFTPGGPS